MPSGQKFKKLPFQVSARTARLIGRENIATNKGAIIELVKNCYDADGRFAIVYFDNCLSVIEKSISETHYEKLLQHNIKKELILDVYKKNPDGDFSIKNGYSESSYNILKKSLQHLAKLYIIDNGEGMTEEIIKNHWMTIGTDNKYLNYTTPSGRIKSGAKGIGRFALDRLGCKCKMTTIFDPTVHSRNNDRVIGYRWIVNWEDFEGEFKTISEINAELYEFYDSDQKENIFTLLPQQISNLLPKDADWSHGTILEISELRDSCDDFYIAQIFEDLETLIPPRETEEFSIFLFSSLMPQKYGKVSDSFCDDFDYKIVAKSDGQQTVRIEIFRNEYDIKAIPLTFFHRKNMSHSPYSKKDFDKGGWNVQRTFSQLIPGYTEIDNDNTFNQIGSFEFTFFYLKKTFTTPDAQRFFYRYTPINTRKQWLEKFGGIKLFRDNFRVRPYGDPKDVAFDWLGLGARKASSPAGIAKKEGGYRVEPDNIAGAIKISRLANINFEDKSSREGLQENKAFLIFKEVIISIIKIFEEDRAYIARELDAFHDERFADIKQQQQAAKIAQQIIQTHEATAKGGARHTQKLSHEENTLLLMAKLTRQKDEEIERLKDEQKLLRGLASCGIVLASFSHDLSKLSDGLITRIDHIKKLFSEKINESEYVKIEDRRNPFVQIEKAKWENTKIRNWLNFSLGVTRKDKRTRRNLSIQAYFNEFKNDWSSFLDERGINLDISNVKDATLRVFEIDIDSIFCNLLVNSIDAFNISKHQRERKIQIDTKEANNKLIIEYHDSGPGISKDIAKPEDIFKPLFTTKRNEFTGEETGTGLGMWLVKTVATDNDATADLLYPKEGFGIRLVFPIKFKR